MTNKAHRTRSATSRFSLLHNLNEDFRRKIMLNPRALTHAQLAEIVGDVQAILWQESRMLPDFPREYSEYWNPGKEWDSEIVEQIADVLDSFDLKPPDFIPVDLAAQLAPSTVIDANELLWAARILDSLVFVHRNVIPDVLEKVKVARAILESYSDVRDFDPREQRWTVNSDSSAHESQSRPETHSADSASAGV